MEQLYYTRLKTIVSDIFNEELNSNNLQTTKSGMTNSSFIYKDSKGKKYVIRINGPGTDKLIDRYHEYLIYKQLHESNLNISDKIIALDYKKGYKISEYIEDARTCNPYDKNDLTLCIKKLAQFHNLNLYTEKKFNIEQEIFSYRSKWLHSESKYPDHSFITQNILSLMPYVKKYMRKHTLCHIDPVCDNFLISKTDTFLIDWEYSAMGDPDLDIAMFALYAMFTQKQLDEIINLYYKNKCPDEIRLKIYCYMALGGLLWSNWCEYKEQHGAKFGKYSTWQYNTAKYYCNLLNKLIIQE